MFPWTPFSSFLSIIVLVRACSTAAVPTGTTPPLSYNTYYTRSVPRPAFPQLSSQAPTALQWYPNAGSALSTSTMYRSPMTQSYSYPIVQQVLPAQTVPLIAPQAAVAPCTSCSCNPPCNPPCKPSCKKCKCKKCKCDPCHCTVEDERIHALGQFLDRAADYSFDPILDDPCEKPKSCCGCKRPCSPKPKCCGCKKKEEYEDCEEKEEEHEKPKPKCRKPSRSSSPSPGPGRAGGTTRPGRAGGRARIEESEEEIPKESCHRSPKRKEECCQRKPRNRDCTCGKPVCCCQPDPYDYY